MTDRQSPRGVVLGSAGVHTGRAAFTARPGLAKSGTYLYDLPADSPERNRIEPVLRQVGHRDAGP